MRKMSRKDLLEKTEKVFEGENRLIQLPPEGKVVFVGDTHGDLEASREVIRRYLKKPYRVIFLGDYVDRGDQSEENVLYLLRLKLEHPGEIFLLAGNHEGFMVKAFSPVDFWDSLFPAEREEYGLLFSKFPIAITTQNGILALHGALPDLKTLEEINRIQWGDDQWDRVTWGDFMQSETDSQGDLWGRPQFGQKYFDRLMERYHKKVLVRSHQPNVPTVMFKKRCVTIFTSHAYMPVRNIVIADLEREIQTADDLVLKRI